MPAAVSAATFTWKLKVPDCPAVTWASVAAQVVLAAV